MKNRKSRSKTKKKHRDLIGSCVASSRVARFGLLCRWGILFRALLGANRVEGRKTLLVMDMPRMALAKDQRVHRVV